MDNNQKTLYVFIDEAGNFDFSKKGTNHFVLTALCTFDPYSERSNFIKCRYDLMRDYNLDEEFFHASTDRQFVRDKVFSIIKSLPNIFEIHSVIAQKNKTHPSLYKKNNVRSDINGNIINIRQEKIDHNFYQLICKNLLQYVFNNPDFECAEKIIVVLGAIFTKDKNSMILKILKEYLKKRCPNKYFRIYFHRVNSDINCQIADYCGWAVYVKYERNGLEIRPYEEIRDRIKSEFDIFRNGNTIYYN